MSRSRVQPSFQSIRSLPGDFRFAGTSDHLEKSDVGNSGNTDVMSSSIPENGELGDAVVEDTVGNMDHQVIEDSPYCGNALLVEDRPSIGDEELDSVASQLPSISTSRSERRWGDTTPYAAKKVFCGFRLKFSFTAKL